MCNIDNKTLSSKVLNVFFLTATSYSPDLELNQSRLKFWDETLDFSPYGKGNL